MASKIPGYHGKFLEIDLSSKGVKTVDLDPQLAKNYVGGRAMGGKMLMDAYGTNYAKVDALGPDAQLLLLAGPYVNFIGCKTNAVFKSPETGGLVASQASSDWIAELRFSGYDGLILKGKASSPVYITIFDDKVEIKDASKWWGKNIDDTHKAINAEYGYQTSQLYIGPAGENLSLISGILTDWYRASGRGGGGAVMGSKNVKAIICKGNGPAPAVADQTKLNQLMDWARVNLPIVRASFHEYGTASGIFNTGNVNSSEPQKNWQSEWHEVQSTRGEFFAAEQWVRRYWADYGCTVACSKLGRVKSGKRAGTIAELPDYEAGALEGTNWGIYDISEMLYATLVPDIWGFDTIGLGNVESWACEALEKGVLTVEDLGGIQLKWGDADSFAKLAEAIALRKGKIPSLLADGLLKTTKTLGKGAEFAVMVKGMELGAHGSRSLKDKMEVSYPVSIHGGDHVSTVTLSYKENGTDVNVAREDAFFNDSVGICTFQGLTRDQGIEWLQAITGFGYSKNDLEQNMIPAWTTMYRISVLLAGWTYKDDVNPARFYEPLPEGPFKGKKVEKNLEEQKKQDYYKAHGWDKQGVPTSATLQKIGFSQFDSLLAPLRAT